jgi:hypothetical protein
MIPDIGEVTRLLEMVLFLTGVEADCPVDDVREQVRLTMCRFVCSQHVIDTTMGLLDDLTADYGGMIEVKYTDYETLLTTLSIMTQHLN